MNTIQENMLTRLSKQVAKLETRLQTLERALTHSNVIACACCGEYYPSKDRAMLNTSKGPICLICIRDREEALEDCTVDRLALCTIFWDAYRTFISEATVDGKRYLSGGPLSNARGIHHRDSRLIAMTLWDYAEGENIPLRSHGGFLPKFNPSDFKERQGVFVFKGQS
jgi:hypothetical protein